MLSPSQQRLHIQMERKMETYLVAIGPSFVSPTTFMSWEALYEHPSVEYFTTIHALDKDMNFMYSYERTWENGWEVLSEEA